MRGTPISVGFAPRTWQPTREPQQLPESRASTLHAAVPAASHRAAAAELAFRSVYGNEEVLDGFLVSENMMQYHRKHTFCSSVKYAFKMENTQNTAWQRFYSQKIAALP